MSTLLVAGGWVVDEEHVRRADVLVQDGRVAAVVEPGQAVAEADTTLDATGLHVLPGVVDAHVHFNEPGRTEWEGYQTGGAAAAAGGVTTVLDMPLNCDPPTLDGPSLRVKQAAIAEHALIDYALWGGVVPDSLDALAELRDGGVVGVKAFLCDSGLPEYPPLNDSQLEEAMRRTARLGLLLALHAEDHHSTSQLGSQMRGASRSEPLDWARSRPPETELRAVVLALEMARSSGARLHFVHISTPAAAEAIAAARRDGLDVSVETCPHYLALDEDDLARLGAIAKCAPPLRASEVIEGLFGCLLRGDIDWVASDHSPCPPEMKQGNIWQAWGGISGVQTTLPILLDEAVHGRGLELPRLVSLTAGNPARRFGLYPRKGALLPGLSDADLTLVDLEGEWILGQADLHTRWPISPFIGRTFRGRVVATLVRGVTVYRQGEVLARPGFGRLLHPGAVPA